MNKKENTAIEVPFEVKFQSTKNDIYASINAAYSNGIPFYLLESIVSDILHQVQLGARVEVEEASKIYINAVEEAKKNENKENADCPKDSEEIPKNE